MKVGLLAVGIAVVLGGSACGGGDGGGGVASVESGAAASGSASPTATLSKEDAQLKFAQCMRENGVDVPDPGGGDKQVAVGRQGKDRGKFERAVEKCRSYLEAGGVIPDLKDPEVHDRFVKFAQCMRQQGIDVPDPAPDGKWRISTKGVPPERLEKAQQACRHLTPGRGR
ncbi:hypothetical protein ACFVH6_20245 [Spirillospora sp. NPDC127200]